LDNLLIENFERCGGIYHGNDENQRAQKEARRLTDPPGAQTLTAYLIVKNAGDAIQFYKKALGAKKRLRIEAPRGIVGHAELRIGTSSVMPAEEFPDMNAQGSHSIGDFPVGLHLSVKDVDAAAQQAIPQDPRTLFPASLTINVPAGKQ